MSSRTGYNESRRPLTMAQTRRSTTGSRRWSENGVFKRIFEKLAKPQDGAVNVLMIDATHLKTRRTASSLKKRAASRG